MSRPVTRHRPTLVPLARNAGGNRSGADHPRRRADDARAHKRPPLTAVKAGPRLMADWPADRACAPEPSVPLWYTKPYLLATLWGRLPPAPKK